MEVITKTDYKEVVIKTLKKFEGKLSVQDLYNVVLPIEAKNRVIMMCVGEDDGDDVYEKPIVINLRDDKVQIEKNYTDIDLRGELIKNGIPGEAVV
jgi:hypothetical protein